MNINNNVEQVPIVWHKFEDRIPQKKEVIVLRNLTNEDEFYKKPYVCTQSATRLQTNIINVITNIRLMDWKNMKRALIHSEQEYFVVQYMNQYDFNSSETRLIAKKQCPIMNRLLPVIIQP